MKAKVIVWSVIAVLIIALLVTLFLRPSILGSINISLPWVGYTYADADKYSVGNASISGVEALDVDWVSGAVEIVPYNGSEVVIDETASKALTESQQVHWYLDGTTLHVRFSASGAISPSSVEKYLTLKVPQKVTYSDVSLDAVSANVQISGLLGKEFKLDSVSGKITLAELTGNSLDVNSVSGGVAGTQLSFSEVKCNAISGEIDLAFTKDAKLSKADLETVSGEIALKLPKDSSFSLELDTVSGDFNTQFSTVHNGDTYTCGDGAAKLDVETVSGNITINPLD